MRHWLCHQRTFSGRWDTCTACVTPLSIHYFEIEITKKKNAWAKQWPYHCLAIQTKSLHSFSPRKFCTLSKGLNHCQPIHTWHNPPPSIKGLFFHHFVNNLPLWQLHSLSFSWDIAPHDFIFHLAYLFIEDSLIFRSSLANPIHKCGVPSKSFMPKWLQASMPKTFYPWIKTKFYLTTQDYVINILELVWQSKPGQIFFAVAALSYFCTTLVTAHCWRELSGLI